MFSSDWVTSPSAHAIVVKTFKNVSFLKYDMTPFFIKKLFQLLLNHQISWTLKILKGKLYLTLFNHNLG